MTAGPPAPLEAPARPPEQAATGGADDRGPGDATALRRRGLAWAILGFAVCPCHLPLTLAAVAGVAGGTAVGDLLTGNPLAVGGVLGAVTVGAYSRAWWLNRTADRCAAGTCPAPGPRPGR